MPHRRAFLRTVGGLLAAGLYRPARASDATTMCLAYTSFAVRMLQGRDILKTTAAALPADALLDLCERFRAGGVQMDLSQLESHDPKLLSRIRDRVEKAGLWLELSVPSKYLETPEAYEAMAAIAGALGVDRIRVALLYGRRYETFRSRDEWVTFDRAWQDRLTRLKPTIERFPIRVGIENHKDFTAAELASLLTRLDSDRIGACVDFGNNVALLEDPLDTIRTLAPWAVTTHVKDMAVRPSAHGFELSEVPLGEGLVPLADAIRILRDARPDVRFCLEMITRDPLPVPYRSDTYWICLDRPADGRLERFERDVLGRAWSRPLPRITHLPPEAQVAAEDENVRRSVAYAKDTLGL
ncbi:MAG TPA: TIM barrel protein [Vicinamibacterales bacterium]